MALTFTIDQFNEYIENGPYAWPGGYPLYFVTRDGEALSFDAVLANIEYIREAIQQDYSTDWRVIACEINWEDADLICSHTGKRIECAYPQD